MINFRIEIEVENLRGIKRILFGIALILIAGAFMISQDSNLGGLGEVLLLIIGLVQCYKGLNSDD
jgi:hypothetical protein